MNPNQFNKHSDNVGRLINNKSNRCYTDVLNIKNLNLSLSNHNNK